MTLANDNERYLANDNEWLQFIEFVKRKYGYSSSEQIRINYYNDVNRDPNKSVAQYYRDKAIIPQTVNENAKLKELLESPQFTAALGLNEPETIPKFTEIYNDTDYLMKSLNAKQDNIYIKCNPVDDNHVPLTDSNNMNGPSLDSINAILTEGADSFSPEGLYSNVGLQIFLCVLLMGLIYGIGYLIFKYFPQLVTTPTRNAEADAGAD